MSTEPQPLRWLTVANPQGYELPRWRRSAAIDAAGTVYAPAAVCGSELKVLLLAAWHGSIALVEHEGHVYLPVTWLAEASPGDSDFLLLITQRVRQHFQEQPR
jgi:hypothetical protein